MRISDIKSDCLKRQLNIEKIMKLDSDQRSVIISLFDQLMNGFSPSTFNPDPDSIKVNIIYNTLIDNDYLVTRREKNLDNILKNEDI
jgi:hypothetical protein